ncbi:MAG: MgtC/SapB family protein [Candidatus Sulfopaludibacter sp.]|nr:MgtC/SapB family protein [Candidatus Sulfopaludibacter sp.]
MLKPSGMPDQAYEILRLAVAYLLAMPVGWHREKEAHSVGVRTFPLVAMASCGYVLLASSSDLAAQSRIIQGLVAGIGFIGGGAILKSEGNVHGTATAASIWTTGVLGAAVAQERYIVAVTIAAINLFTLRVLLPWKQKMDAAKADKTQ